MSYEPTNWQTGDIVSSQRLNKIEQGIAANGSSSGVLVVHAIYDEQTGTETLDKTLQEIYDAMSGGTVVFISSQDGDEVFMNFVFDVSLSDLQVTVEFFGSGSVGYYIAESASGYPVLS